MEVKLTSKFHLIFILDNLIQNMINDNVIEKEENLKELVIKLLKERNLSDFELLDSSFSEIKKDLHNDPTK